VTAKLVELKDFKTKKKIKKVVEDLDVIIKVMNLTLNGLSRYSKYIHVAEAISSLQTNKTLLEISRNKYGKILEGKDK